MLDQEMQFLFEMGEKGAAHEKHLLRTRGKLGGGTEETPRMQTMRLASMLCDKNRDHADLDFRKFQAILDVPGVQDETSYMILDELNKNEPNDARRNKVGQLSISGRREVIQRCLSYYDKQLFLKLRDGELTVDQVDARLSAKHAGVNYKVLDDFKG